jgi:hypothetical protein
MKKCINVNFFNLLQLKRINKKKINKKKIKKKKFIFIFMFLNLFIFNKRRC